MVEEEINIRGHGEEEADPGSKEAAGGGRVHFGTRTMKMSLHVSLDRLPGLDITRLPWINMSHTKAGSFTSLKLTVTILRLC